jgi:cAMP-binding proteins - catabolite gene activator and regulatory subunit of cAMP-dependent protein kinases
MERANLEISIMMKSKVFDGFSKTQCEILHRNLQPYLRQFNKGEIVIQEGDSVRSIAIIFRGKLIGMKLYYEGDTHLMRTYGPGETVGVEAIASTFETSPLTFVAGEDSEILLLPMRGVFEQLEEQFSVKLLFNMIHVLADDNIKLIYKTEVLSKRSLRERIMTYLSIIQRKKDSDTFRILMNQQQFAQYLCVNRSALSYELNQMKREGIIYFEKDSYRILNK